jgi:hypothetical protein
MVPGGTFGLDESHNDREDEQVEEGDHWGPVQEGQHNQHPEESNDEEEELDQTVVVHQAPTVPQFGGSGRKRDPGRSLGCRAGGRCCGRRH